MPGSQEFPSNFQLSAHMTAWDMWHTYPIWKTQNTTSYLPMLWILFNFAASFVPVYSAGDP